MPQAKNSKEVLFFRAGYRDATNYKDGLKPKERLNLNRDDEEDARSKIQNIFSETKQKESVKEMTVFVRRRHFPIIPFTSVVPSSTTTSATTENNNNNSNNNDDTEKEGDHNNNNSPRPSPYLLLPPLEDATKDFSDIMNVILVDEPLPEVRKRETQTEIANPDEYNLPPGARIEGDRVIVPAREGLFGGMTPESSLPLSFYKKKPNDVNGGGGLFGAGAGLGAGQSSLFGTTQNQFNFGEPTPAPQNLFSGFNNTNGSSLFGAPVAGGKVPQSSTGGFNFGAAAKAANNNNNNNNASGLFSFGNTSETTAQKKKPAKPPKVGTTSSIFGAPTSFNFGDSNEEPQFTF